MRFAFVAAVAASFLCVLPSAAQAIEYVGVPNEEVSFDPAGGPLTSAQITISFTLDGTASPRRTDDLVADGFENYATAGDIIIELWGDLYTPFGTVVGERLIRNFWVDGTSEVQAHAPGTAIFEITDRDRLDQLEAGFTFTPGMDPYFRVTPAPGSGADYVASYTDALATYNITYNYTDAESGVPEPAAWTMMISGFGLIGGAMRRQRVSAVSLTAA